MGTLRTLDTATSECNAISLNCVYTHMNTQRFTLLAGLLLTTGTILAQTAPTSGTITYETMRRFDLANMRVNVNGQEVRPGAQLPNGRTFDPPETIESEESFQFAGNWAKRDPQNRGGAGRMFMMGGPGGGRGPGGGAPGGDGGNAPQGQPTPEQMQRMEQMRRNFRPPVEETQFTDLTTGKSIQLVTVKPDSLHKETYRADVNAKRPADWQVSNKTKKILGYTCQKATCTIKEQPCTVWFTTELPYTFSPAPQFTPDKGVVLWIESDDLAYRATKLNAGSVDVAKLTPDLNAKVVSDDELREIRRKAMATMRQQRGSNMTAPRN